MSEQSPFVLSPLGQRSAVGAEIATPARPRGAGDNVLSAASEDILRQYVRQIWQHRRRIEREQRLIKQVYDAAHAAGLRRGTVKEVIGLLELDTAQLDERLERAAARERYWSVVEDLRDELHATGDELAGEKTEG
jgi:uncharacterized protein (UPF0335 family)